MAYLLYFRWMQIALFKQPTMKTPYSVDEMLLFKDSINHVPTDLPLKTVMAPTRLGKSKY